MSHRKLMRLARIISNITDEKIRRSVATEIADMFAWGNPGFNRDQFLKGCCVEGHTSPYLVIAEEM